MNLIRVDAMGDYSIRNKIGEGSYSTVFKAQKNHSSELYAIKVLKDRYKTLDEIYKNAEINVMGHLGSHPNMVSLQDVVFEPKKWRLSLVMDLMECNMLELLQPKRPALSLTECLSLTYQLLSALSHIHNLGYIHRDIKPENCLINVKTLKLKLADFGSTKKQLKDIQMTEYIATRWYRPPECLLTSGNYGPPLDVWAVGCVFYELMTKKPLFPGSNTLDQLNQIHGIIGMPNQEALRKVHASKSAIKQIGESSKGKKIIAKGIFSLLPKVPPDVIDLLEKLLAYVPDERITAAEALKHRAFNLLNRENLNIKLNSHIGTNLSSNIASNCSSYKSTNYAKSSHYSPALSPTKRNQSELSKYSKYSINREVDECEVASYQCGIKGISKSPCKNPRIYLPNKQSTLIKQSQSPSKKQSRLGYRPSPGMKMKPQSVLCQGASCLPGIY
ncbi:MAPK/MAK/MRK overlapping kinase [Tritrichomonas foetus]|uniref:MAPK/MAK/MRK overlapping kinase n=1 Tax=Tritrichomonas foetus TaxID=1144522 RepID=A0A1J4KDM4_9EUKA|nr:MAPK/MAK/MRK overlapping kinase [Tritrichomonas foetus]|eukprot:OHT09090.1 MAPK/MAK/MRK overlapping kinase [Tritrichomonas foetus]